LDWLTNSHQRLHSQILHRFRVISKGYPHPDWFFWRIWQDGDRVIFKWVYRVLGWPLDPEYRIYDMTNTQLTLEAR